MPTLTISPESAFAILLKAREFDVKEDETDPDSGSNPTDDGETDVLEFGPDDETLHELASAIRDLNDDEQRDLLALILVGRGDYSLEEWSQARRIAGEVERPRVPRYVAGIPLVSDYLEEGLSQFNLSLEDYLEDH
jgi:hypothetical protein